MVSTGQKSSTNSETKSGIRTIKPGEVLFAEGEMADSLFIIQKGQLRLFLPKGKGFVDLAVLRAGEVLGEMAYFDEKARQRSCSAAAIVTTEVIEISFNAFGKTMGGLNPWFKTIINTLADRLRHTNAKVKELESNSVGLSSQYKFFSNVDIVRLLTLTYMAFRAHAKTESDGSKVISLKTLKFYASDIFAIGEAKILEFVQLLSSERHVEMCADENNQPNIIKTNDFEKFNEWMTFLQSQRLTADDKQIKFHASCEKILDRALQEIKPENVRPDGLVNVDITKIIEFYKEQGIGIFPEDLDPAIAIGLATDIIVGTDHDLTSIINYHQLRKVFLPVKFYNSVVRLNEDKKITKSPYG